MKKIICLGDSLTNGARDEYYRNYPLELTALARADGRSLWCLNYGVNGDTTGHIADRAYGAIAPNHDARFLLNLGGTNDSKVPIPAEIYEQNVRAVVDLARDLDVEPALGLVPPVYGPGQPSYSQTATNALIREYNDVLTGLASEHGLRTCDFSRYGPEFYCDGIHLTHAGYARMAADWYSVLRDEL